MCSCCEELFELLLSCFCCPFVCIGILFKEGDKFLFDCICLPPIRFGISVFELFEKLDRWIFSCVYGILRVPFYIIWLLLQAIWILIRAFIFVCTCGCCNLFGDDESDKDCDTELQTIKPSAPPAEAAQSQLSINELGITSPVFVVDETAMTQMLRENLRMATQIQRMSIADDNALRCKVCMDADINVGLNCGHTFCKHCANQFTECAICKRQITERNRLYF